MKKIIPFACMFLFGTAVYAQLTPEFRLNAYGGYIFDDRVESYYSATNYFNAQIKGSFHWGAGVEFLPGPYQSFELSYYRQDTNAPTTYYDNTAIIDPVKDANFDVSVNYILIGGTRYAPTGTIAEPFFGAQIGLGIADAENPLTGRSASATKFAWSVKAGSNFWVAENVAIKLQCSLQSIVQGAGGELYFGSGGIGAGVATYSSVTQFSLGGGLVFRFKKKLEGDRK